MKPQSEILLITKKKKIGILNLIWPLLIPTASKGFNKQLTCTYTSNVDFVWFQVFSLFTFSQWTAGALNKKGGGEEASAELIARKDHEKHVDKYVMNVFSLSKVQEKTSIWMNKTRFQSKCAICQKFTGNPY